METLIDDLLTLARQGDAVADPKPIDLRSLVGSCWEHVATGDATLRVADDGTVRADAGRLRQLFENLFRNAVEHGSDSVTVTVGRLPDGFYVADDGPGVPADDREAVFEPGYSTASEGTGFGLNIVTRIAEDHGWEVGLTDGADGGARFEITGVAFED
jgi:signal transduction histidine kinase